MSWSWKNNMKKSKKPSPPFIIECSELTMDEELALAGEISESLKGEGVALVNGPKIIIDAFSDDRTVDEASVERTVVDFVSRRKDHEFYSVERVAEDGTKGGRTSLKVHSADPVAAASRRRSTEKLPPNLMKCPFCSFVTPYEELYVVHVRSHGFGM